MSQYRLSHRMIAHVAPALLGCSLAAAAPAEMLAKALDPPTVSFVKPAIEEQTWYGPDGEVLPFRSDEEILEFLRTAHIDSVKDIGTGVTGAMKVVLEKDGVRMRACFRNVSVSKNRIQLDDGRTRLFFRDECMFEVAAYELSRMLGLHSVPPVVQRRVHGRSGSLQAWVEGAMTQKSRLELALQPPDSEEWRKQTLIMRLFDNLIYNEDRNQGNYLIQGEGWKLWMIDHTRAFRRFSELLHPETVLKCERDLWSRLKNLDEQELRRRMKPCLNRAETNALLKRRLLIIEALESRIQRRGEAEVLYSMN